MFSFRKANVEDAAAICSLISYHQFSKDGKGSLIGLDSPEIAAVIESSGVFMVAESVSDIVGCCSLVDYPVNGIKSAELRSLAVQHGFQRQGIGSALVELCVDECIGRGLSEMYALTQERNFGFFRRLGFSHVEMPEEKLWRDCYRCPRYKINCDEKPMVRHR